MPDFKKVARILQKTLKKYISRVEIERNIVTVIVFIAYGRAIRIEDVSYLC